MENSKIFAEHAVLAVNRILQQLADTYQGPGPALQYEQVTEQNKKNIGSNTKGLYMFFVRQKNSQQVHSPAYVGYTGRSFHIRFKEHADDERMIGKFFEAQQTSLGKCDLFVSEFPCRPMIAKLLESMFLEAFDFALNKMENNDQRSTVDLYVYNSNKQLGLSTGKKIFKETFAKVMKEFDEIRASMQDTVQCL